jgi:hypothetical protein
MRIRLFMAAALLGASLPTAGQEKPAEPPKTGSVAGIIIDQNYGDAVPKAIVILRHGEEEGIGATTGADGKFLLRDVDPGAYAITVEKDGIPAAVFRPESGFATAQFLRSEYVARARSPRRSSGRVQGFDPREVASAKEPLRLCRCTADRRAVLRAVQDVLGQGRSTIATLVTAGAGWCVARFWRQPRLLIGCRFFRGRGQSADGVDPPICAFLLQHEQERHTLCECDRSSDSADGVHDCDIRRDEPDAGAHDTRRRHFPPSLGPSIYDAAGRTRQMEIDQAVKIDGRIDVFGEQPGTLSRVIYGRNDLRDGIAIAGFVGQQSHG